MNDYPVTTQFTDATIVLPLINETVSLTKTVEIILRETPREWIREFIIVVCQKTKPESMAVAADLQKKHSDLVVILQQQLPFLGGALRDSFACARGSHVIIMASDMETDPMEVRPLIEAARKNPDSVVTTSRWIKAGQFQGYSSVKLVCNWLFQHFFSLLYGTHLTDMTFGFRILPTRLVQAIRWEEVRHPFNLESVIKPLRLGVPVTEISTGWQARTEGESQNPFFRNFAYFKVGLRARFASRASLLKPKA